MISEKFQKPDPVRKRFPDTVKIRTYRDEGAMTDWLVEQVTGTAAARRLLQDLFMTNTDLFRDAEIQRIAVHAACRPAANRYLRRLFYKFKKLPQKYLLSRLDTNCAGQFFV